LASLFLCTLGVLRRAVTHPGGHLRILAGRHFIRDSHHVDLVPPIVAEIEPVAEHVTQAR